MTPKRLHNTSLWGNGTNSIDEASHIRTRTYPNPTNGVLFIELGSDFLNATTVELNILDVTGKLVLTETSSKQKIQIATLKGFSKGIYFLKVSANDKVYTEKIIVK